MAWVLGRIKEHGRLLGYALILILIIAGVVYWHNRQEERYQQAVVIQQDTLRNLNALQNRLHINEQNAIAFQEQIKQIEAGRIQPVTNYYVAAPTVQAAADKVQEQIKNKDTILPPQALANTDRTVVTPNTDKQKVDVYKIDLDKPRGVGVYVSTESAGAMVQYKNFIGFGGPKFQGGYEIGAGYMIRF